jgi:ribonuclease Z
MKIPLTFLGTSQAVPTAKRNHIALLLKYKNETILIDCGEGTQRQFRKAKINPCKLTRILITHWHGDHVLGLPGLFQTLALNNYSKTLHIHGPKGTKRFIALLYKLFIFKEKLKIKVHEVKGKFLETPDFYLEALPLQHGAPCNAYNFVEKDKRRLNKAKLKKLKLPHSPLIKKLQQGKNIKHNGKTIKANTISSIQKGKKISFILDTALCKNCYTTAKQADLLIGEATYAEKDSFILDTALCKNCYTTAKQADLLIGEATYAEKDKDLAKKNKHLTARQIATIAKKSKAKKLILSHISQRYDNKEKLILNEAKKLFKNTTLAEDFDEVEI